VALSDTLDRLSRDGIGGPGVSFGGGLEGGESRFPLLFVEAEEITVQAVSSDGTTLLALYLDVMISRTANCSGHFVNELVICRHHSAV
jgi:hypothetical protein